MNTRIDGCVAGLRERGEKGFVAYLCAGDPSLAATVDTALRLEEAGADIIELGVPFSDPLADGRVNQAASARALAAGTTVAGVLDAAARIRARSPVPVILFTYLNPILAYGLEDVAADAAAAGIDGCLCLDLPVEESADYAGALRRNGLDRIFLVAPTSPEARIRRVAEAGTGFVYCVSREGVTGMRQALSPEADRLLRRTRAVTRLPIVLGFGVSTPDQARSAVQHAEAVVVGSAIVDRFAREAKTAAGRRKAAAWVKTLVDAVKEG